MNNLYSWFGLIVGLVLAVYAFAHGDVFGVIPLVGGLLCGAEILKLHMPTVLNILLMFMFTLALMYTPLFLGALILLMLWLVINRARA